MSTPQKPRASRKPSREDRPLVPQRYRHVAAIAGLALAILIFLFPVVFGGKTFVGPDSIASHSFDTLLQDAKEQGIFPLWNPYIFGGMPAYGSLSVTGDRWYDLTGWLWNKLSSWFGLILGGGQVTWVVFYYILFAAGMYVLAYSKVRHSLAAFVAAFGATFSMFIIIWIMVSHNTKIATMAPFPWLLFVADRLRERFRWLWALLAVVLLHFMFMPSHVQMIFYAALAFGGYFLMLVWLAIRHGEPWKGIFRSAGVLVVAAALAFAMDSDRYLSVLEYNPSSIRGSAPLIPPSGQAEEKTQAGGLDYEYATQWSLAPGELISFAVPTWYGFGHLEYDGPLARGPMRFNGYWGPQPFTDAAQYMGIVILVLAVGGFIRRRRDPFVLYLGAMIVFSILVAFGKELPLVYDAMFAYVPMFNKFRIPSMILVLVQIYVPLLAAYGVATWMGDREHTWSDKVEQKWKRVTLGLGVAAVLAFVGRGAVETVYQSFFPLSEVGPKLGRQFGQVPTQVVAEFYQTVVDYVAVDIIVALILCTALSAAVWFYGRRAIGVNAFAAILITAAGADLWRINSRVMDPQPRQSHEAIFAAPDYVQFLQRDTTLYRTLTFQQGQLPYDNTLAYFRIQSAYGYQGAKMRAYQDMVEVAGLYNPLVWQMMNVKYIISDQYDSTALFERVYDGQTFDVFRFRNALPRAFFVNRFEVASAEQTLNQIANGAFDPRDLMYVLADPGVGVDPPEAGASVEVTEFGIQHLKLKATATGTNLLFLSETYYQPGWKAFIDGKEEGIIRANYLFRGLVVPAGDHAIEMRFEPSGFALGKNLSLAVNLLVIVGFGAVGFFEWRERTASKQ